MLQVCKIRDINVSGKINKITTTQKITLISNNVRYYALQYTPFAAFGKSIFVMVFFLLFFVWFSVVIDRHLQILHKGQIFNYCLELDAVCFQAYAYNIF